jgi:hypothetical protein
MAYSDFTVEEVVDKFSLAFVEQELFPTLESQIHLSSWLIETLAKGKKFALTTSSEKAKSEFIIAPILLEVEACFPAKLAIYSGKNLDSDRNEGLVGECDFIIGKGSTSAFISTPIIAIVEAKRDNLENGLGQCAAQMYGAIYYNQKHGETIDKVYGCVTTGNLWQFLKLENKLLTLDSTVFYLNELDRILSCFSAIVTEFL